MRIIIVVYALRSAKSPLHSYGVLCWNLAPVRLRPLSPAHNGQGDVASSKLLSYFMSYPRGASYLPVLKRQRNGRILSSGLVRTKVCAMRTAPSIPIQSSTLDLSRGVIA